MLGNPELERALLEQTYDGVMTVTGTRKQEVGGETVVTPDAVLHEKAPVVFALQNKSRYPPHPLHAKVSVHRPVFATAMPSGWVPVRQNLARSTAF